MATVVVGGSGGCGDIRVGGGNGGAGVGNGVRSGIGSGSGEILVESMSSW